MLKRSGDIVKLGGGRIAAPVTKTELCIAQEDGVHEQL
jgi:hypothetical protein